MLAFISVLTISVLGLPQDVQPTNTVDITQPIALQSHDVQKSQDQPAEKTLELGGQLFGGAENAIIAGVSMGTGIAATYALTRKLKPLKHPEEEFPNSEFFGGKEFVGPGRPNPRLQRSHSGHSLGARNPFYTGR